MQRIMILGSGGSGKSTLARHIGLVLNIPVTHLDQLFWQPNWNAVDRETLIARQQAVVSQPCWIMDGNYTSTLDVRLAHADTVILLNTSRWRCLYRVVARRIAYHGQTRPDMGADCLEQLTWEFLMFIWNYPKRIPALKVRLNALPNKRIIVLNTPAEVKAFIATISKTKQSGVQ
ncbi:MAG: AAA family ATPase [Roseiflexaceae bacterium]